MMMAISFLIKMFICIVLYNVVTSFVVLIEIEHSLIPANHRLHFM